MILIFVIFVSVVRCSSLYDASTTSIQTISTEPPQYQTHELSNILTTNLIGNFFDNTSNSWVDSCSNRVAPVVWQVAVAGRVMTNSGDVSNIQRALDALSNYKNSHGSFSASTNKNQEVYTDDNSQVSWVYTDAYSHTFDDDNLQTAKTILGVIESYQAQQGGILWSYQRNYISLISTLEAALAALRYSNEAYDQKLVDFAVNCIQWVMKNFVAKNGFIVDGEGNASRKINGGQLTYTIGTLISCCAYLDKLGDFRDNWKDMGIDFGVKFINGGHLNDQFFTNGYINDPVEHSHLLFVGLVDLLTLTNPVDDYQQQAYKAFKQMLVKESRHLRDIHPEVFQDSCPKGKFNTLLKYASIAQIFNVVARIVDMV